MNKPKLEKKKSRRVRKYHNGKRSGKREIATGSVAELRIQNHH